MYLHFLEIELISMERYQRKNWNGGLISYLIRIKIKLMV